MKVIIIYCGINIYYFVKDGIQFYCLLFALYPNIQYVSVF